MRGEKRTKRTWVIFSLVKTSCSIWASKLTLCIGTALGALHPSARTPPHPALPADKKILVSPLTRVGAKIKEA
jgi:hypothetical protein